MKTDLEKIKQVFDDLKIYYVIKKTKKNKGHNVLLRIDEGIGYMGFYCDFYFLDGKFVAHGIFE